MGLCLGRVRSLPPPCLGACLAGLASPAVAQSDEQRAGARSLATEGAQAFNEGRFKDAVDLFSKAESLMHAPPHLLFMARAHAKLGQFVKAREAYMKIVEGAAARQRAASLPRRPGHGRRRAQAGRAAHWPAHDQGRGRRRAKDLVVAVDGQPISAVLLGVPQPMDPGDHTMTATATGFKAAPGERLAQGRGRGSRYPEDGGR